VIGADRCAAAANKTHQTLPKMLHPPTRPIGRGNHANTTRLQHAIKFTEYNSWIFDVFNDLVRGDKVEYAIRKWQVLKGRLRKLSCTSLWTLYRFGESNGGYIDSIEPQVRITLPEIIEFDSGTTPCVEQIARLSRNET